MTDDTRIPEANIGLVGHVDHGKTTLTDALSGEWTDTHSEELKRGITIRLGYADVTIRQCPDGTYTVQRECEDGAEPDVQRTVSLVDAPGHETLMANVLSGAAIMDGALLMVAANEDVPQPQTREHLAALDKAGIENIIVVQNKIDLVDSAEAKQNYQDIKDFLAGSVAEDAPIIPISAQHSTNIDVLLEAIQEHIPTPEREIDADPKMLVARSFDVNKPGSPPADLKGGVVGGSLQRGELEVGDTVELRPGYNDDGTWRPIKTEVQSIIHGSTPVDKGKPGGLLAVETDLDPAMTKSDNLSGNVLGLQEKLPPVRDTLTIDIDLMDKVVGTEDATTIENIKKNEPLLLNIGTGKTSGVVTQAGNPITVDLKLPVCAEDGDRIAISRRFSSRWRLIGGGTVKNAE